MAIVILVDPDKSVRPENSIRCDVAWKLFLPDGMGDVNLSDRAGLSKFTQWLWRELSDRLGSLRKDSSEKVYMLTPPLSDAASGLLVRIASMWADEVHMIESPAGGKDLGSIGGNLWKAPKVNTLVRDSEDPLINAMSLDHHGHRTTFFMPALGSARSFIRRYEIEVGGCYARLHSHSAVEEHYLVLDGKGTVRYGGHAEAIEKGDLISKPVGPDNYTQLLADRGEVMTILDIEVWPDTTTNTKDLVLYPDHNEILMRGQGWNSIVPRDDVFSSRDFGKNYDNGYSRLSDGSWAPKKVPGVPERSRDSE